MNEKLPPATPSQDVGAHPNHHLLLWPRGEVTVADGADRNRGALYALLRVNLAMEFVQFITLALRFNSPLLRFSAELNHSRLQLLPVLSANSVGLARIGKRLLLADESLLAFLLTPRADCLHWPPPYDMGHRRTSRRPG